MIRNNLFYKLLALGVAVTLWGYVNAERNPQARKVITVALEARNAARGYATELDTAEATIELQGPKMIIDNVRREDAAAWVDLQRLKPGPDVVNGRVKVEARIAGVGEDELNMAVNPHYVRARIEAIRSKRLPVEVKFLSAPPLGYSYSDPELTPDSVEIHGKATQVAQVQRAVVPVSNVAAGVPARPFDGLLKVIPTDSRGSVVKGVQLDKERVRLKLGITEVPATKTVVVSETITGRPKFPAKVIDVSVTPQSVTLEGKPKTLTAISTVETDEVSIEGIHETITREVALRIPRGVRAVNAQNVRVTVTIAAGE